MKKKGGAISFLGTTLWVMVILGITLAIMNKLNIVSLEDMLNLAKEKAIYYTECIPANECGLLPIIEDIKPTDLIINQDVNIDNNKSNSKTSQNEENSDDQVNSDDEAIMISYENISEDDMLTRDIKGYRGLEKNEPYVTQAGLVKKQYTLNVLDNVKIITPEELEKQDIDIKEWTIWKTSNKKPCWSTKEKVLSRDVKPGTAVYFDKYLEKSKLQNACGFGRLIIEKDKRVIDTTDVGEWICPYTGKQIKDSSELTVDHIVSIEYASQHGAENWDKKMKETFANDTDNLLTVSIKGYNIRNKKNLNKYMPYSYYKCQYAKTFINILNKYKLNITQADKDHMYKMIRMCQY